MKKVYIIVPKKLGTNPPVEVGHGFMAAQVHHATVLACNSGFKIDHQEDAVIVLQVPNQAALLHVADRIAKAEVGYRIYFERSKLFLGATPTAVISESTYELYWMHEYELWS